MIGGFSGVMHSSAPADAQQHDSYFVVAHFHYVMIGGALFALFAGVYYWFPKITGRMMHEGLGKLNFWVTFIGFNITFFPMHLAGLLGMPRRIYTYGEGLGLEIWNLLSTIGSYILAVGVFLFMVNVVRSWKHGELAGEDPWDARTLEWTIESPPKPYNFARIPVVSARDELWERKYGDAAQRETAVTSEEEEKHGIHMPSPSYFPLLLAVGLTAGAYGLLYSTALAFAGLGVIFLSILGWAFEGVGGYTIHPGREAQ